MEPLFIWFFTSPTPAPPWALGQQEHHGAGLLVFFVRVGELQRNSDLSASPLPPSKGAPMLPLGENDFLPETLSCSYPLLGNSSEF